MHYCKHLNEKVKNIGNNNLESKSWWTSRTWGHDIYMMGQFYNFIFCFVTSLTLNLLFCFVLGVSFGMVQKISCSLVKRFLYYKIGYKDYIILFFFSEKNRMNKFLSIIDKK